MYQSSGNEKGCCLFSPSSTKHEIWQFHVVVVQRRQEMYKKSMMHKVLFDQSNFLSLFCRSRCRCRRRRRRRCVNSLRWRRRQQERQKSERFRLAKKQLCKSIALFCTFLYRHCTTTTWNCQISRFVEDGKKRQQLSFSFPELWCSSLKFNFKKNLPTFDELSEVE